MKSLLTLSFLLLFACNDRQQQGMAQITERRRMSSGQLLIQYRFYTAGQWIQDSVIIANRVLPQDSVKLFFSPGNPRDNRLELP